jgi:hypothetical protein
MGTEQAASYQLHGSFMAASHSAFTSPSIRKPREQSSNSALTIIIIPEMSSPGIAAPVAPRSLHPDRRKPRAGFGRVPMVNFFASVPWSAPTLILNLFRKLLGRFIRCASSRALGGSLENRGNPHCALASVAHVVNTNTIKPICNGLCPWRRKHNRTTNTKMRPNPYMRWSGDS